MALAEGEDDMGSCEPVALSELEKSVWSSEPITLAAVGVDVCDSVSVTPAEPEVDDCTLSGGFVGLDEVEMVGGGPDCEPGST